uniref:Uncharacterized protein n=1 Tax=Monodon monoceros TaxID=40151 RepID=A0A8C6C7M4_MONMO
MASVSKLPPVKVLTGTNNREKMNILDLSLDDIIILRKIGMDTEEIENETQNNKKNTSVSRQQSNADKHHQQRGEVQ